MSVEPVVLSHWGKLIEGLQATPLEFYESIEQGVEQRQLPETERSRVDYFEGGVFSAKREYLRVQRKRLVLDISGAPFGTGFFVSWWLGELRSGPWKLLGILLGLLVLTWLSFQGGFFIGVFFMFFGIPLILVYLARQAPPEFAGWDDPILSTPFIGSLYQSWFKPTTRYKIDITLAFQQSVHAAVLEVVDDLIKVGGLRALSEVERQPILREFFRR